MLRPRSIVSLTTLKLRILYVNSMLPLGFSMNCYPQRDLDKLFKDYNVQENIDTLHRIVLEAKERKALGEVRKDAWKEDLDPRTAVCARTIPHLESEAERLRERLAAVR